MNEVNEGLLFSQADGRRRAKVIACEVVVAVVVADM